MHPGATRHSHPTPDTPSGRAPHAAGNASDWLEALPDPCALLDADGTIVAANEVWHRQAPENADHQLAIGANFRVTCRMMGCPPDEVTRVLAGEVPRVEWEHPLRTGPAGGTRWYHVTVARLGDGALVTRRETTQARNDEETARRLADQRLADRHYYEELLAHVPAVVWEGTCAPDGTGLRLNFVSRFAERLLGYALGDWLTTPDFFVNVAVHPDDRERVVRELAAIVHGDPAGLVACRWVGKDGQVLWVESHVTVLRPAGTPEVRLRGITTDSTARRQYEDMLRQRNAELAALARSLKRTNEELDQYAYITSHDLKAPLRGISNLSSWIEEDLGPVVTPDAHAQLELLRGRVRRMEALIDGILAYSRVGRVHVKAQVVDTARLLRDVADLLAPPPGFRVETDGPLPTVIAERTRLQQVLMNLISNAIKHHHDPTAGRVVVSARDLGDRFEFSVADDGPGIDPAYHHKIWIIFQTLRPRDQVEGTGVGLSLVRKIVEDQGGAVRLESAPGKGSTFSFTWQKDVRTVRPDAFVIGGTGSPTASSNSTATTAEPPNRGPHHGD